MQTSRSHHTVHPWFHMVLISTTSLLLTVIFYVHLQLFETREALPSLITLTPAQLEERGMPTPTTVGLYIRDFSEFDMLRGKFTADLVVWFRCNLAELPLEKLATFTFERATIQSRSEPIIYTVGDSQIVEYNIRASFVMPLNFKDFPLDDHRLDLTLSSPSLSTKEIAVNSDAAHITISPEAYIEGWKLFKKTTRAGYMEHPVNLKEKGLEILHPRIIFSLDFERSGIRQVASILLPLLVIFFITLLSFSVEPVGSDLYNVISMSVASILALIAYRFVIETISPATSYFTLSDYMFIFFLVAASIILFANALGASLSARGKIIITLLLHVATILLFAYLLIEW